jgi:hypothetical protein
MGSAQGRVGRGQRVVCGTLLTASTFILRAFGIAVPTEHLPSAHQVVTISTTGGIAGGTGDLVLLVHRKSSMKTSGPSRYDPLAGFASTTVTWQGPHCHPTTG